VAGYLSAVWGYADINATGEKAEPKLLASLECNTVNPMPSFGTASRKASLWGSG